MNSFSVTLFQLEIFYIFVYKMFLISFVPLISNAVVPAGEDTELLVGVHNEGIFILITFIFSLFCQLALLTGLAEE